MFQTFFYVLEILFVESRFSFVEKDMSVVLFLSRLAKLNYMNISLINCFPVSLVTHSWRNNLLG